MFDTSPFVNQSPTSKRLKLQKAQGFQITEHQAESARNMMKFLVGNGPPKGVEHSACNIGFTHIGRKKKMEQHHMKVIMEKLQQFGGSQSALASS